MKITLLMILFACGISIGYGQEKQEPHNSKKAVARKTAGSEGNPIFVKQAKTSEEKTANDKQAADAKENLDIQRASLKASQDALAANQDSIDYTKKAAWAAIIAAGAACLAFLVAVGQLLMFLLQLRRMGESNVATQKSAEAAADAALATQKSVEHAEKRAMPILLPAVVSIDELFNNEKGGALYPSPYTPKLRFVFENLGETPAIIIEARAVLTALPMTQFVPETNFLDQCYSYGNGTIIRGGYSKEKGGQDYVVQTPYELTVEEQKNLRLPPENENSMRFFYYGRVIYDDVFGIQHERGFGRRLLIKNDGSVIEFVRGAPVFDYYKRYDRRIGERAPGIQD